MPQGLEIYASDGSLQVSSDLICWFCRKSGSGTVVANSSPQIGNTAPARFSITISGAGYTYPLIAVSVPGYFAARAQNISGDYHFITDAPVGTTFYYWIYDYGPVLPAATFGMETFNASGQRTFSSEYFPLKILTNIASSSPVTHTGKALGIMVPTICGDRSVGATAYYLSGSPVGPGSPYDATGYQNTGKLTGGKISNTNQTATFGYVSYDDVYVGPEMGDIYKPPDWTISAPIFAVDVTAIPASTTFF